jgi:hypothetical protein
MQTSLKRIAISLATAGLILVPAAARAANPHNPMQGVAVGGTSADGNVFKGTMDVLGFVNDGGVVKAIANLNGTLTSAAGAAQQVANAIVLMPVNTGGATAGGLGGAAPTRAATTAATTASCQILHLDLGPLDLNLLGLNVHLNEVVLDITATPGAGNLLGNLLCGVANLLNGFNLGNILGTALANTLTTLLNNILMAL